MSNLQETPQNPSRHLPIGTILQGGKYKILEVLGQGGFGITYLAEHSVFGEVALKELFLNSGTIHCSRENTTQKKVIVHFESEQFESFKVRFLKEAKTLYNLSDVKGVVHVRDIFEENGTAYFSMDYVRGEKLSDYIEKRKPLPKRDSLNIVRSLSEIVVNIHKHNILHRDIKPDNVIIDDSGEVNLIDFGIAREQVGEEDETHTTFHSPRYSPPEQKSADSPMGDYSDVFSLGATAYYVFTGVPPQRLEDRMLQSYDSPIKHIPSLPAFISDTIDKSLEVVMNKRIQTAHEFLKALSVGIAIDEVPEEMPSSSDPPIPNEETTFIDTSGSGDKTMVDHPEVPDESTIIDEEPGGKGGASAQEKGDEDATQVYEEIPATLSLLDRLKQAMKGFLLRIQNLSIGEKRFLFAIALLIMTGIICMNLYPSPSDDPIEETIPTPVVQRHIKFCLVDTSIQQLNTVFVMFSDMDISMEQDPLDSFWLDVTHQWDQLKNDTLTILSEGFFPETRLVSDLVGRSVADIQLMPIALPDIDGFIDTLQKYDWINEQKKALEFTFVDTTINHNPAGKAKYQKNEVAWWIERTPDSTFILVEGVEMVERFFVPLDWEDQDILSLISKGHEEGALYVATPKKVARKQRILNVKIEDENGEGIRSAEIVIGGINKTFRTDGNGGFRINLTNQWEGVKDERYTITRQGYESRKRRVRSDIGTSERRIKLIKKTQLVKLEPIMLNCSSLEGYWTDGRHVVYIKSCSGDKGWAFYDNKGGPWERVDDNGQVFLHYVSHDGSIDKKFQVRTPQDSRNIRLGDKNTTFKKSSKEDIFCENVEGKWKYIKKGGLLRNSREIEVSIQNCAASHGNQPGGISHDGKETTFLRSEIKDNNSDVVLSFRSQNVEYNIYVKSPLVKDKLSLTIEKKKGDSPAIKLERK